jgi:hypothetical protein
MSEPMEFSHILGIARKKLASTSIPQDMPTHLCEVQNFSVKVGVVTPELLPEVMFEVQAWRNALRMGDPIGEARHRETFRALTWCLNRGRVWGDPPRDCLPFGKPSLEGALWHLHQLISGRTGTTDRELLEALDAVLEADRITPTNALSDEPIVPPTLLSARHSLDFRSVHWFGANFTFSPTQAACMKVLWQAWENGTPELGQATILEHPEVEAESKRLVDVFKGHPAWGTILTKGTTNGTFRLIKPVHDS